MNYEANSIRTERRTPGHVTGADLGLQPEKLAADAAAPDSGTVELPIRLLREFRNHPFQVNEDEKMMELVESIRENGVLNPVIVRRCGDDMYEIISGHRRTHASRLAGLRTVPATIRELSDDEAVDIMVDSNIQRGELKISEKVRSLAMKAEAMKHRGTKGAGTYEEIGKEYGEHAKTIQRYLQMNRLSDELLWMVDDKKIGMTQAQDLSFLSLEIQECLVELLRKMDVKISGRQSKRLKEEYMKKTLTRGMLSRILSEEKEPSETVKFSKKTLGRYFAENTSREEMEHVISTLLTAWSEGKIILADLEK